MIDPIDAAVIRSGVASSAREMFGAFKRTAMLPHLYEATDFSVSVYDDRLNLVADVPGVPEFIGSLTVTVPAMLERASASAQLMPGDVLVANDPFLTGAHPADAALLAPAFSADGTVVGYCGMRAHMGDLGALNNYPANARSVYDEGLVLPPLHLTTAGVMNEQVLAIIAANSRLPSETVGNFRSGAATLLRGAVRVAALVDRYGLDVYHGALDQLMEASEHEVRALIETIPDGDYQAEDLLELAPPESSTVVLRCTVRVRGSSVTVDVSESAPQQPGALNVPLPQTISVCRLALKRLTTQNDVVANSGEFRMLEVIAPEGSIFNVQRPAASYMMATTASLLSEMIVTALSPALEHSQIARTGGHTTGFMSHISAGPRGRPAIIDDLAPIGYGATPDADGMDAALHFCLAAMGLSSGEVLETRGSVIKRSTRLVRDSGGAGRWRGGVGVSTVWEVEAPATLTIQAQRTIDLGGEGLCGGGSARGRNDVEIDDGRRRRSLGMSGGVLVGTGETITVHGAGGGGYGDPVDREPERVAGDVVDGYVSAGAARDLYGVVVDGDGIVDVSATAELRAAMRARADGGHVEDLAADLDPNPDLDRA